MNLAKSYEFFQPEMLGTNRIHIIGCGSIGSTLAVQLAKLGIKNISLYDFDTVSPHNIANQMFDDADIGREKVDAVEEKILRINPDAKDGVRKYPKGWIGQKLSGFVFLCVDSIELRRKIATEYNGNHAVKAMFDFRTRLTDAQHYAADWANQKMVKAFIDSMNFTHEEAAEATPMSACHVTLCVAQTVWVIVSFGMTNFINFVKGEPLKKMIMCDVFAHDIVAF